jgi:hypothetical protein
MPLRNSPDIYSGGNVVFDSTPSTNLYAQLMAKKQAKDEAIDEYYKKLPNTLNGAGMRDNDREGFDEGLAKAQQYWMQNRDKIRKGNTPEAFNYEQIFRELGTGVQNSKNAAKTDLELGKMRFNKENGYIFEDPDFMETQRQHTLPVWDKSHKAIDLGTVTLPTAPFDQEQQDKLWASVTKGVTPGKKYDYGKQYKNPQTGQVIVPFAKTFDPEQVEKIADQASGLIKDNKSAKAYYTKMLNNPERAAIDELQKAYNKVYKGMVDTPEKAAAADAIIRASVPTEKGEEQEINYQQRVNDRPVRVHVSTGSGASGTDQSNVNDLYERIRISANDAKNNPRPERFFNRGSILNKGAKVAEMPLDQSNLIVDFINKSYPNKGANDMPFKAGDLFVVSDDNDKLIIYDSDKNKLGVLPVVGTNIKVQPSVKEKKEVVSQGEGNKPKSNGAKKYKGLDKNGNPIFE